MKPEIDENFSIIAVNNECFIVQQLYSLHFCNNHVTAGQLKFCIVGYCSGKSLTLKYSAVNVHGKGKSRKRIGRIMLFSLLLTILILICFKVLF